MRKISPFVLSVIVVGVSFADEATQKEMAALVGDFSMVSGEANGMQLPTEMVAGGKRVAKDGVTTVIMGGQPYFSAKFTIDPTKTPKTIDYDMTEGPTKGQKHLGIYEIEGETVRFCFAAPGKDRPVDFTAKQGSM